MNVAALLDALALFRKGNEVANPEAWKDGGNAATVLVPLLMGAVKLAGDFGIGIQLDATAATAIAGGIVTAVHFVVLNVSSARAGIVPAKRPSTVLPSPEPADATIENAARTATELQPVAQAAHRSASLARPPIQNSTDPSLYFG